MLSKQQKREFVEDGYLVIPGALFERCITGAEREFYRVAGVAPGLRGLFQGARARGVAGGAAVARAAGGAGDGYGQGW